ncbi:MAG: AvaI/BsoBI family type II restriction endonuclease [Thermodesulfobacteriota bacterium]
MASKAKFPSDLLDNAELLPALVAAAGVSDKAAKHLTTVHKREAILGLLREYLEPAGPDFVEELVFRFLLNRGDTLGGSMRNVGGFMAQCKLSRCLLSHLTLAKHDPLWLNTSNGNWQHLPADNAGIEHYLKGLHWKIGKKNRTLIYNLTVPMVKNNIDLCLIGIHPDSLAKSILADANAYLAFGELKGGIDPAGADEHWKTATTALKRIHDAFNLQGFRPKKFFIGAAIEEKMATEIWSMLETGYLDNAANLTNDAQMNSIASWLCAL